MRHGNISVFVPHIGCPHRCSFCNQNAITGKSLAPTADDVINAVKTASERTDYNPALTELAFFGGSFTAIDRDYMTTLLNAGYEFVKAGIVSGIRISTRPDAINEGILDLLKKKGVIPTFPYVHQIPLKKSKRNRAIDCTSFQLRGYLFILQVYY